MDKDIPQFDEEMLSPELIQFLCSRGALRNLKKGEVIFRRGEPGDTMYFIEQGAVGLFFEYGKDSKTLLKNSLFGELAMLGGNHLRAATAIAASPCHLREFSQEMFNIMEQETPSFLIALLRRACLYLIRSERDLLEKLLTRTRILEQSVDYAKRTREELDSAEILAQTDELTGLYNRRCLDYNAQRFIARSRESGAGLALLVMDLDHFKQINDRHGHDIGDLVLRLYAHHLRRAVRQTDLPFRMGGDEFGVLLPEIEEERAMVMAKLIMRTAGMQVINLPHAKIRLSSSIGGTMIRDAYSFDELYKRADLMLYKAKNHGRNRICFDEKMILF